MLILPGLLANRAVVSPRQSTVAVRPLRIDVDRASWHEWALFEGIGETRGRAIEAFVRARRPLGSLDVLEDVPGLPSGWLEKARPYLWLPAAGTPDGETRGAARRPDSIP